MSEKDRLEKVFELVKEYNSVKTDLRKAEMSFVDPEALDLYRQAALAEMECIEMQLEDLGFYKRGK